MATNPYGLRSKLNSGNGVSVRTTPSNSPFPKAGTRSPRKPQSGASLNLRHVIGTTTTSPSGFSSHAESDTFAYCAGCAAVLAKVSQDGSVIQRFYKARPIASSVNPFVSFYDSTTPTGSPSSRRRSILPGRFGGLGATPTGSPLRGRGEEGESQTWTARERIKAVTCVSLSRNGRFVAFGETGYSPRVLLFSTAEDAPFDLPLSIMSEHSFGVRAVAFSGDSRYLATLGDINDGFLFVWSVNPKTGSVRLHSTNKCTTNVSEMVWCGSTLVTVGTRHIKVWRVTEAKTPSSAKRSRLRSVEDLSASPAPIPLQGRNCLLGALADCTFTCATAISDHEVVVCTDDGQLCILDDVGGAQELKFVKRTDAAITSMSFNVATGEVFTGGDRGRLTCEKVDDLRMLARPTKEFPSTPRSPASSIPFPKTWSSPISTDMSSRMRRKLVGIGCLSQGVVTVDSESHMEFIAFKSSPEGKQQNGFAAHDDSVQGLQILPDENGLGAFFTWSRNGVVKFWDTGGVLQRSENIELERLSFEEDECSNELMVMHYLPDVKLFASGDRFGVLKLMKRENWREFHEARAHSGQITDVASENVKNDLLIATTGRDRVVQLFRVDEDSFELLQTMEDHIGAVSHVLFTKAGEKLLTSSADRTVIIREQISRREDARTLTAYLTSKVVTLKATPISMAFLPDQIDMLAISTMDRCVVKLSLATGSVTETFKVADPENDDTAVLNSVCLSNSKTETTPRLLVGYSSTDKSIRVYDFDKNILLTRESGHTEGISAVALLEDVSSLDTFPKRTVISTGLDGTIMLWSLTIAPPQPLTTPLQELSQGQAALLYDSDATPVKASPATLPPMRKVLSKLDIPDFNRAELVSGSPAPIRDPSPARLRRKPSRLTVVGSKIPEHDIPVLPAAPTLPAISDDRSRRGRTSSPSPPPQLPAPLPRKQRSQTEVSKDATKAGTAATTSRRSPSPHSYAHPVTAPSTPRGNHPRANNARLRRPPSIPVDLRAQALAQGRRKSTGNVHDFGSVGMAGEQACRMLRMYRKKLIAAKEEVELGLGEVQEELIATLGVVQEKVEKGKKDTANGKKGKERRVSAGASASPDVDSLTSMLEKTLIRNDGET